MTKQLAFPEPPEERRGKPRYLSTSRVAKVLCVTTQTITRWIREGKEIAKIAIRAGRAYKIDALKFREFYSRLRPQPAEE